MSCVVSYPSRRNTHNLGSTTGFVGAVATNGDKGPGHMLTMSNNRLQFTAIIAIIQMRIEKVGNLMGNWRAY